MSEETSYAAWACQVYENRLAPVLCRADREILAGIDSRDWTQVCGPGENGGRYRLYPGALMILWAEALGGCPASAGAEPVAAALELMHNSSLVHDDVLDGHVMRRGQPTLRGVRGEAFAVLAGDGLAATAFRVLGEVRDARLPGVMRRLGEATEMMLAGQILDQPDAWASIPRHEREAHWHRVCHGKLALGNASASLGAFWAQAGTALEEDCRRLMDRFSAVSQIINDFGDLLGVAGYHQPSVSGRIVGEESRRKPLLPLILADVDTPEDIRGMRQLCSAARRRIECHQTEALQALERLPLQAHVPVLRDFFLAPRLSEVPA